MEWLKKHEIWSRNDGWGHFLQESHTVDSDGLVPQLVDGSSDRVVVIREQVPANFKNLPVSHVTLQLINKGSSSNSAPESAEFFVELRNYDVSTGPFLQCWTNTEGNTVLLVAEQCVAVVELPLDLSVVGAGSHQTTGTVLLSGQRVRRARWHPMSDVHVAILTEKQWRLVNLLRYRHKEVCLDLPDVAADFCFSTVGSIWSQLGVYVLYQNGRMQCWIPILPALAVLPRRSLEDLKGQLEAANKRNDHPWHRKSNHGVSVAEWLNTTLLAQGAHSAIGEGSDYVRVKHNFNQRKKTVAIAQDISPATENKRYTSLQLLIHDPLVVIARCAEGGKVETVTISDALQPRFTEPPSSQVRSQPSALVLDEVDMKLPDHARIGRLDIVPRYGMQQMIEVRSRGTVVRISLDWLPLLVAGFSGEQGTPNELPPATVKTLVNTEPPRSVIAWMPTQESDIFAIEVSEQSLLQPRTFAPESKSAPTKAPEKRSNMDCSAEEEAQRAAFRAQLSLDRTDPVTFPTAAKGMLKPGGEGLTVDDVEQILDGLKQMQSGRVADYLAKSHFLRALLRDIPDRIQSLLSAVGDVRNNLSAQERQWPQIQSKFADLADRQAKLARQADALSQKLAQHLEFEATAQVSRRELPELYARLYAAQQIMVRIIFIYQNLNSDVDYLRNLQIHHRNVSKIPDSIFYVRTCYFLFVNVK